MTAVAPPGHPAGDVAAPAAARAVVDRRVRQQQDLRISVTDRCNVRCTHCTPRKALGPARRFLPRRDLLDVDELVRVGRVLEALAVRKIRLTGGEPELRRDVVELVARLVEVTAPFCGSCTRARGALAEEAGPAPARIAMSCIGG
ncbi:radical SAM protein [Geodermatophilus sp. CPCC 205506]|uniref:radical SAM protein n=1 Tax=Geodermatophilus sp. CPCC 205506 TaxID=2936596 RepID=UPI003EEBDC24